MTAKLPLRDGAPILGIEVLRGAREQACKRSQSLLAASELDQHVAAVLHRRQHLRIERQHPIVACERFGMAFQRRQHVAAVEQSPEMVRP